MKSIIVTLALAVSLAACNSKSDTENQTAKELVADTSSNYSNSVLTDTGYSTSQEVMPVEPVQPVVEAKKTTKKIQKQAVANTPSTTTTTPTTASAPEVVAEPAPVLSEPTPVVVEEKKKGWSNATKGAVIGAGAGAIGGAVISKKKGKGAVIGGVLGAAGGYIIGKNKDKKDTLQ